MGLPMALLAGRRGVDLADTNKASHPICQGFLWEFFHVVANTFVYISRQNVCYKLIDHPVIHVRLKA
jgi:hypothetical protein